MNSVYNFPSDRPFTLCGRRFSQRNFNAFGRLCQETGRFNGVSAGNRGGDWCAEASAGLKAARGLTPTTIRYIPHLTPGATGLVQAGTTQVGRNWQTLMVVRGVYQKLGLENAPTDYNSLDDTHLAMAVFQIKMNIASPMGRITLAAKPASLESLSDSFTVSGEEFAARRFVGSIANMGHGQDIFPSLANSLASVAARQVMLESFFSEININAMMDEIAEALGADFDKDYMTDIVTKFGKQEKRIFNAQKQNSFERLAQNKAEYIYSLLIPDYDTNGSPNFAEFKQSFTALVNDMYAEAVRIFNSGEDNRRVDSLWNGMWTSDRTFNIGGQIKTMREMDDMVTFMWTGTHRVSAPFTPEAETEPAPETDEYKTLAEELAAAIQIYKQRMLEGLNALTEDDIEAKVQEFKAKFEPVDGTPEEMANFKQLVMNLRQALTDAAFAQRTENLVVTAAEAQEKNSDSAQNAEQARNEPLARTIPQHEFARLSSIPRAVSHI